MMRSLSLWVLLLSLVLVPTAPARTFSDDTSAYDPESTESIRNAAVDASEDVLVLTKPGLTASAATVPIIYDNESSEQSQRTAADALLNNPKDSSSRLPVENSEISERARVSAQVQNSKSTSQPIVYDDEHAAPSMGPSRSTIPDGSSPVTEHAAEPSNQQVQPIRRSNALAALSPADEESVLSAENSRETSIMQPTAAQVKEDATQFGVKDNVIYELERLDSSAESEGEAQRPESSAQSDKSPKTTNLNARPTQTIDMESSEPPRKTSEGASPAGSSHIAESSAATSKLSEDSWHGESSLSPSSAPIAINNEDHAELSTPSTIAAASNTTTSNVWPPMEHTEGSTRATTRTNSESGDEMPLSNVEDSQQTSAKVQVDGESAAYASSQESTSGGENSFVPHLPVTVSEESGSHHENSLYITKSSQQAREQSTPSAEESSFQQVSKLNSEGSDGISSESTESNRQVAAEHDTVNEFTESAPASKSLVAESSFNPESSVSFSEDTGRIPVLRTPSNENSVNFAPSTDIWGQEENSQREVSLAANSAESSPVVSPSIVVQNASPLKQQGRQHKRLVGTPVKLKADANQLLDAGDVMTNASTNGTVLNSTSSTFNAISVANGTASAATANISTATTNGTVSNIDMSSLANSTIPAAAVNVSSIPKPSPVLSSVINNASVRLNATSNSGGNYSKVHRKIPPQIPWKTIFEDFPAPGPDSQRVVPVLTPLPNGATGEAGPNDRSGLSIAGEAIAVAPTEPIPMRHPPIPHSVLFTSHTVTDGRSRVIKDQMLQKTPRKILLASKTNRSAGNGQTAKARLARVDPTVARKQNASTSLNPVLGLLSRIASKVNGTKAVMTAPLNRTVTPSKTNVTVSVNRTNQSSAGSLGGRAFSLLINSTRSTNQSSPTPGSSGIAPQPQPGRIGSNGTNATNSSRICRTIRWVAPRNLIQPSYDGQSDASTSMRLKSLRHRLARSVDQEC